MKFSEVVEQVLDILQRQGRVSYRMLKREFELDDEYIDDLKAELIDARRLAVDEDGKVLVRVGATPGQSFELQVQSPSSLSASNLDVLDEPRTTYHVSRADGERRRLTVMFCDLVGSTALSEQLDPEDLQVVVQAYQDTCAAVIQRYEGYIAQHLGDGLLVYFGYPRAHEDEAHRAVQTGLGILVELPQLNARLQSVLGAHGRAPLQVRIGVHTGLVVVSELGSGIKREILALGETPNIAARLQGLAEPDTVVLSAASHHLVAGLFECQDLGPQPLKGISTPLTVYRVVSEGVVHSRFEAAVRKGLTPLVGREHEVGLLRERWERVKQGEGQVVLLNGEPGIGKSRLLQALKEQVTTEGATRIEFRCSAYHQNSSFYPIIEHLQRLLQFAPQDMPQTKLAKLQQALMAYRFPQADTVPLLASLLSLPYPEGVPSLPLSPQKQKQKTQEALVAWVVEEAEKAAVHCVWEDLHWADPSTLELLTLVLDQVPTIRLLALLTFRPDFILPWRAHSHITQLTLSRLGRPQVEAMVEQVTGGKALPAEVLQQIVVKTDGVPLFVEELTKSVLESGLFVGATHASPLPLAIPTTLHDALMARLDRLNTAKEIVQVAATLGREFSYDLLHAVFPLDEAALQQGLRRLVEAEVVYQRGLPLQATYLFKHALIQDAAYQSLLKSKRQQLHQQIAQVLEEQFPETKETQPELLAHHYTEAGLVGQAIPYWQQAGQRATQRSAYVETINHLRTGLELLKTLPDTDERAQQELTLQIALGASLMATKGYGAPEVEKAYTRARELCQQVGETPQLPLVLWGLWAFYLVRAEHKTARELGEQLLALGQSGQDPAVLSQAHYALGATLFYLGEFAPARAHLEQGIALYNPQQHRSHAFLAQDARVTCLTSGALTLWFLGYPDQALERMHKALALAQELSHPFRLAWTLNFASQLSQYRREWQIARERAEAMMTLATEQGFPYWLTAGTIWRGVALAEQGQVEEGILQMQQGVAASRATRPELGGAYCLVLLAGAYGKTEREEEGLGVLAEVLAAMGRTGERMYEAELYRLKGELTLAQSRVQSLASSVQKEAEECFWKAIEIARKQSAKSLELRAVMSLSRLWQNQGKKAESRQVLAEIYNWFTEGFDTKDLQEAKELLAKLQYKG